MILSTESRPEGEKSTKYTSILIIDNVDESEEGIYVCTVRNDAGKVRSVETRLTMGKIFIAMCIELN